MGVFVEGKVSMSAHTCLRDPLHMDKQVQGVFVCFSYVLDNAGQGRLAS